MTTELTIQERATEALTIDHTETELVELASETVDVTEIKDNADYELVKRGALVLRDVRISIERAGKEARSGAQAFSKAVIAEQKRLVGIIGAEEERLKALRKEVDDREARIEEEKRLAEQQRIEGITSRITAIGQLTEGLLGADSEAIKERLGTARAIDLSRFSEYSAQASTAQQVAVEILKKALDERIELEAQKADQERITKEQVEKQVELDRQAETLRKEREAIDAIAREEEEHKLAAERAEAEKVRQEKEALEAEQREANELQRRKEESDAEVVRQEALRPDREKLEQWAGVLKNIEPPVVSGNEYNNLINEALKELGQVGNKLLADLCMV